MALNLSLLPASVQRAIAANPDLYKRSITDAPDRARSLTIDMGNWAGEGGYVQPAEDGVHDIGINTGTGEGAYVPVRKNGIPSYWGVNTGNGSTPDIESTYNGLRLFELNGSPWQMLDSTVDFSTKNWKPGAEQAVLGSAKWDDQIGLMFNNDVISKYWIPDDPSFMDRLVPALILSAVGMGIGQMVSAGAGGFMPAAQSGFESGAMFSGGAGGVQGGAVAGGVGGGGGGAANVAGRVAGNTAGGIVSGGAPASTVIGAANPAIVAQTAAEASFLDGLAAAAGGQAANNLGNVTGGADGTAGATGNPPPGGGPGGAGSITDTIKNIYNTVKPYKDALSLVQTGASVIQGVNNRNAMSDAADKQAATAAEQLRQQQAAQQAQEEAAKQALEIQRQAQEKLLAQQNAQLQEQLRLQQSMASYQQQVYSQQLAQAAKEARLAEEQLRRNSQRNPDFAAAVTGNRRAGAMGVGGTMLTGADGVDPQSLLLGRATLLGG